MFCWGRPITTYGSSRLFRLPTLDTHVENAAVKTPLISNQCPLHENLIALTRNDISTE